MSKQFFWYPKCSTCRRAKEFLDAAGIIYETRDIKLQNPTYEELQALHAKSGLPLKQFFNTSGLVYKELALKDKLPTLSNEEKIKLLASDGMLVKRPIFENDRCVLVGFKEDQWKKTLSECKPSQAKTDIQ